MSSPSTLLFNSELKHFLQILSFTSNPLPSSLHLAISELYLHLYISTITICLDQGSANCFVKVPVANILGFVVHTESFIYSSFFTNFKKVKTIYNLWAIWRSQVGLNPQALVYWIWSKPCYLQLISRYTLKAYVNCPLCFVIHIQSIHKQHEWYFETTDLTALYSFSKFFTGCPLHLA